MPWYVKIERGIVDKASFDQYVPAHKHYVQQLIADGHCARTGYWADSAGGMLLFEAASMTQAQALVQQDPLVSNHCVEYVLHEWVQVSGPPLST